jgi:DNA-binding MarR family transcriptional regulator
MTIKKTLKLSNIEYYEKHLHIINPFLPVNLTIKEIEVLSNLMSFTGTIAEDRFGTTARNIIKKRMAISTAGISNYIASLKKKGFITNGKIHHILFPNETSQSYEFTLENYEN